MQLQRFEPSVLVKGIRDLKYAYLVVFKGPVVVLALNPGEPINSRHKLHGDVQKSQLLLVGVWRTNDAYSDDLCESRVQSGSDPVSRSFIEPTKI